VREPAVVETKKDRLFGLSFRAFCAWVLGILLVICGIAVRVSPMDTRIRVLLAGTFLFTIFTCFVFLLSLIGKRPVWIFPTIFFLTLFIVWSVLGSKPPDQGELGKAYNKRLHAFVGAPFAWGGEAEAGIDCSGLARASLWQAMVRQGVKEFNPRLLGPSFWHFWWRDMSARDMDEGKYGYTRVIGHAKKLAGYDNSNLNVGDMAIGDKTHVMVYCGEGDWIEASPTDRKVVINKAPARSKRAWFNEPVTLVRWWILDRK